MFKKIGIIIQEMKDYTLINKAYEKKLFHMSENVKSLRSRRQHTPSVFRIFEL